jgi:glycosyltransferase involved in cell wall biosynthesis
MAATRILLIRDGDFFIHLQQLAELLHERGCDVEVLHTANAEPEPLYRDLLAKTRGLGIACHLVHSRGSWLEQKLIAMAFRAGAITTRSVITPHKVRSARRLLAGRPPFDAVIAIDPASLLLACRLFPDRLDRIVDYSLEVSDESHRDFQTSRVERHLRLFERAMLPKIGALLIQDRFRARVLLQHVRDAAKVTTIYMPVAINGAARPPRSDPRPPFTVLFFGGLWSAELLGELEGISRALRDGQRLRIQGGRGTVRPLVASPNLEISTEPVPFDRVNDVIAAADLGLAVYPQAEANSRCSAFAGEKVARYLQCGLPFIAFDNEDYAFLRDETGCCELVRSYDEIPAAINTIVDNYERYQRGARLAFEKYYWRGASASALMRYLEGLPPST